MTRQEFLEHCKDTYGTSPDYPFDDLFETAVLRHADNRKWYALVMKISRKKFGFDSDETVDVVNLKLPTEMFGSFDKAFDLILLLVDDRYGMTFARQTFKYCLANSSKTDNYDFHN